MAFTFSVNRRATRDEVPRIERVLQEAERRRSSAWRPADYDAQIAAADRYQRAGLRRISRASGTPCPDVYAEDPRGSAQAAAGRPYLWGWYVN